MSLPTTATHRCSYIVGASLEPLGNIWLVLAGQLMWLEDILYGALASGVNVSLHASSPFFSGQVFMPKLALLGSCTTCSSDAYR